MSKLFESHRLFESTGFLPEKTLPSGEVGAFEESMLKDSFNSSQCLNHVSSIIIQIPQFSIMSLMSPPERVLFEHLKLLEILSHSPSLIISQCQSILLEKGINSWDSMIPTVLQIV